MTLGSAASIQDEMLSISGVKNPIKKNMYTNEEIAAEQIYTDKFPDFQTEMKK